MGQGESKPEAAAGGPEAGAAAAAENGGHADAGQAPEQTVVKTGEVAGEKAEDAGQAEPPAATATRVVTLTRAASDKTFGMNLETCANGMTTVSELVPSSIAADAGLCLHDKIIAINEIPVPGLSHEDVIDLIRGKRTVNLLVCPSEGPDMSQRVTFPTELSRTATISRENGRFGFELASFKHKHGSYVIDVQAGSPAAISNAVVVDDRLTVIDGEDVTTKHHAEVVAMLADKETATLTFVYFPGEKIANLVRGVDQKWGVDVIEDDHGSVVHFVKPGTPAGRCANIQPGDYVVGVNQRRLHSHAEVIAAFTEPALHLWVHLGSAHQFQRHSSVSEGRRGTSKRRGLGVGAGLAHWRKQIQDHIPMRKNRSSAEMQRPLSPEHVPTFHVRPDGRTSRVVKLRRGADGLGFHVGTNAHKTAFSTRILEVLPGTPAEKAELQVNDVLTRINSHDVSGQPHRVIVTWLQESPVVELEVVSPPSSNAASRCSSPAAATSIHASQTNVASAAASPAKFHPDAAGPPPNGVVATPSHSHSPSPSHTADAAGASANGGSSHLQHFSSALHRRSVRTTPPTADYTFSL